MVDSNGDFAMLDAPTVRLVMKASVATSRLVLACATLVVGLAGCARTGLDRDGEPSDADLVDIDAFDAPDPDDVPRKPDADAPDIPDPPDVPDAPDTPDTPDVPPDLPVGVCGDGTVDRGEACDDGPANSDTAPNACRTDCTAPRCGDGVVDAREQCDDGNGVDADACDNACRAIAEPCTECDEDLSCGRVADRCAELVDGQFCLWSCGTECPAGFVCETVETTNGRARDLCVPEVGVCSGCFDPDGDGWGIGLDCPGFDCDETNPNINPGADEICDDLDNDCDGQNDEGCPPDLIIDAETVEMSGSFLFDRVEIRNGGVLRVTPAEGEPSRSCGPPNDGCVEIEARVINIRAGSGIDANGAGNCALGLGDNAGFGPGLVNVGPGGGAYGGAGGAGTGLSGGSPYGNADRRQIQMGSPGRGFLITVPGFDGAACDDLVGMESFGGQGGGCVSLMAQDIDMAGYIRASGYAGEDAPDGQVPDVVDGGAGGAGGGVMLQTELLTVRDGAEIVTRGAPGGRGGTYSRAGGGGDSCIGNGGGGGGGGRIKVFAIDVRNPDAMRLDAGAGVGAPGPQSDGGPGGRGTVFGP